MNDSSSAKDVASEIETAIRALPAQNALSVRDVRREYSQKLRMCWRPESNAKAE
ncbi:MAG: hypothetical protein PVH03_03895 [Chloroflexota bacterium]|jgi:hypothetical protein